jgi:hypothetical protein
LSGTLLDNLSAKQSRMMWKSILTRARKVLVAVVVAAAAAAAVVVAAVAAATATVPRLEAK